MADHYVPGPNAHLDTHWLQKQLELLSDGATRRDLDDMELEGKIYGIIEAVLQREPQQPEPEAIVCRFLDVEKFLWFATSRSIYFGRVSGFDDSHDCALPRDYHDTVQAFYLNRDCPPLGWDTLVNDLRRDWLISCWTLISNSYDDYLLWHRYAGGSHGIGITIPYGAIRDSLARGLENAGDDLSQVRDMHSGLVAYKAPLRLIPFNKRRIFENEKELRFVAKLDYRDSVTVDVSDIFKEFRLRFSPDVPWFHKQAMESIWKSCGGTSGSVTSESS